MKTVSLDLAKKLKKAGFPQESAEFEYCGGHIWYHDDQIEGKFEECGSTDLLEKDQYCHKEELTCEYFVASPTADEILERLPENIFVGKVSKERYNAYKIPHIELGDIEYYNDIQSESLADAAAECWLYLKKKGLL